MKLKLGKIINNIFLGFSIVVFLFVCFIVFFSSTDKKDIYILGYKPYVVVSDSMYPYIKVNSIVITKRVNYNDIKVGDVISFDVETIEYSVCHRVIEITDDGLVTKGDNSAVIDVAKVREENLNGKLVLKTNILADILKLVEVHGVFLIIVVPIALVVMVVISVKMFMPSKKSELVEDAEKEE